MSFYEILGNIYIYIYILAQTHLPQNGDEWAKFRNNIIPFPEWTLATYSKALIELILQMLQKNIDNRPELVTIIEGPIFSDFSVVNIERTPSPEVNQINSRGIQQFLIEEDDLFGDGSGEKKEIEGVLGGMKFSPTLVQDYDNLKERNILKEDIPMGIIKMKPLNLMDVLY